MPNEECKDFVAKLSADGGRILYSGVISGNAVDCGCCSGCFLSMRGIHGVAIAVDAAGGAYVPAMRMSGTHLDDRLRRTGGRLSPAR